MSVPTVGFVCLWISLEVKGNCYCHRMRYSHKILALYPWNEDNANICLTVSSGALYVMMPLSYFFRLHIAHCPCVTTALDSHNVINTAQELNASNGCQLLSLEVYPHATLNTQFYIYSTQFYIYMVDFLISMRKISFPWQNPVKPLKIRGQSNLR